jgi:putative pyoverdin transport system ATP-binding/permease protein
MTKLLVFLIRHSRGIKHSRLMIFSVISLGILSGISNTALLALINRALTQAAPSRTSLYLGFSGLCLFLPVSRFVSEVLLVRLSFSTILNLRLQLSRGILEAPLRTLEEMGAHRILAILTDDIPYIANAIITIPVLFINTSVVITCLCYLGWLSWKVLLGVICFVAIGVAVYESQLLKAMGYFKLVREQWNSLFEHFRALTEGAKELKLHCERREAFLKDHLKATAEVMHHYNVTGNTIQSMANCGGQALVFILIGLLIFVLPSLHIISHQTLIGYTLAMLYMMTPLQVILNTTPTLGRAGIAVNKVEEFGISLPPLEERGATPCLPKPPSSWKRLELTNVLHSYHQESDGGSFMLGPLNLSFSPGEMVFLIGGNGSGKTTFAKLLIGLYAPEGGEIRLDHEPVTNQTRERYRQYFSAVFSEFFIFETLLGINGTDVDARSHDYLKRLHLDHKVEVKDGKLSTTALSRGQRKRLALLAACLEDRPFYVFDEWAADQDPVFKEIFYHALLPELRARGKAVLVISHDDRYYPVADRIVKLDSGQISYDRRNIGAVATSQESYYGVE